MAKEKLVEVLTPNPDFEGIRLGFQFKNGKAMVSVEAAEEMVRWGYRCPALEKEEKPLEEYTINELRNFAKDRGIELGDAKKKAEILKVIEEAMASPQNESEPPASINAES